LKKYGKPEADEYFTRLDQLQKQRQLTDRVQQLGNFGLEAFNARNWSQAIADLKEALQICGDCRFRANLHWNLGLIYCRKGDIDGATESAVSESERSACLPSQNRRWDASATSHHQPH
jgi:tetratricopeptide (TPR) repeat protein